MARIPEDIYRTLGSGIESLSRACEAVEDEFVSRQLKLSGNMFIGAVNELLDDVKASKVRDVDFAFNDVVQLLTELPPVERDLFEQPLSSLREAIDRLHEMAALPEHLVGRMKILREKMVERRRAAERATFRPPEAPEEPLPHDPAGLRREADEIRQVLQQGGFETPAFDRLATATTGFPLRECSALVDEIDAIIG